MTADWPDDETEGNALVGVFWALVIYAAVGLVAALWWWLT